MRWTQKALEEERLKCLFRLGGGELERGTWNRHRWYEGAPDYAERECREFATDRGKDPWDLRTALEYRLYGTPGAPRGWVEIARYTTSGEADCWWCGAGTGEEERRPHCKLCEGSGHVYLGDGWGETVYARIRAPRNR